MRRYLIVNADDFGLSEAVNRGIIQAHENGIVTSASLMVRYPAASGAVEYASNHERLAVGLHFDFAEWVCHNGEWSPRYQVVNTDNYQEVFDEAARQLEAFRKLMRRDPTHLDSHQHFHRNEPVRTVLQTIARDLCIPLRGFSPHVRHCGDFYGQTGEGEPFPEGISIDNLLRILSELPSGASELGCHPGMDEHLQSVYRKERFSELAVLCDSRLRSALVAEKIELRSFKDLLCKGDISFLNPVPLA
jgi:predicted glycoside hydrolase/deacetylase ChbG (UPF0249 family)